MFMTRCELVSSYYVQKICKHYLAKKYVSKYFLNENPFCLALGEHMDSSKQTIQILTVSANGSVPSHAHAPTFMPDLIC